MNWDQADPGYDYRVGEKRPSPFEEVFPQNDKRPQPSWLSTDAGPDYFSNPSLNEGFGQDFGRDFRNGSSQQSVPWSDHLSPSVYAHGSFGGDISSPSPQQGPVLQTPASEQPFRPQFYSTATIDYEGNGLGPVLSDDVASEKFVVETDASSAIHSSSECSPSPALNGEALSKTLTRRKPDNGMKEGASDEADVLQFDTCFGVLEVDATSSIDPKDIPIPVRISSYGDVSKMYHLETAKYVGLVTEPVVGKLLQECEVHLSSHLHVKQTKDKAKAKDINKLQMAAQSCFVRIVVYGARAKSDGIRDILNDSDFCLQTPSLSDVKDGIAYHNPQYLVRPDSRIPQPHELLGELDELAIEPAEQIDEVTKSRVQHIFDSASDWVDGVSVDPSPRLRAALKRHQLTSLSFMIEKEAGILQSPIFPSLWTRQASKSQHEARFLHSITGFAQIAPRSLNGGILADDMGLGKTLSLLALVCSSLDAMDKLDSSGTKNNLRKSLIIVPKSTLPGWQHQIQKHLHVNSIQVSTYHGTGRRDKASSFDRADLVLTTYDTVRSDFASKNQPLNRHWYRLVLDEAHRIRNRSSLTFRAVCSLPSVHRWCLTGTPIQNSLDDFGALLGFLRVPHLENKTMFDSWISRPLKDIPGADLSNLRSLVSITCLRRTKHSLKETCNIPSRQSRIESVSFHRQEQELYDFFKRRIENITAQRFDINDLNSFVAEYRTSKSIVSLINILRLICNHGEQLLPAFASKAWYDRDGAGVTWQAMRQSAEVSSTEEGSCDNSMIIRDNDGEIREHRLLNRPSTVNESLDKHWESGKDGINLKKPQHCSLLKTDSACGSYSSKIRALLDNLNEEQRTRNNVSVGRPVKSFWTKMLDLIESALQDSGYTYARIDGSTSLEARALALEKLSSHDSCTVMLASIGSAGEGVDFTAANHVHLIEPHWNPMAEAQAIDRVHRIGQERDVTVTRYIVSNSIEEVSENCIDC